MILKGAKCWRIKKLDLPGFHFILIVVICNVHIFQEFSNYTCKRLFFNSIYCVILETKEAPGWNLKCRCQSQIMNISCLLLPHYPPLSTVSNPSLRSAMLMDGRDRAVQRRRHHKVIWEDNDSLSGVEDLTWREKSRFSVQKAMS